MRYTFVYFIASPNHDHFFSNKVSWLHIHTNKSSTKFQVDWTSSSSTVKCSKVDVLGTLLKMFSPPNDTPIFCKFLHIGITESSEIWRDGSYWLIESYCAVFMGKTYCLELKIEFNDFTVSLRGGWLYQVMAKKFSEFPRITTITQLQMFVEVPEKLQEIWSVFWMDFYVVSASFLWFFLKDRLIKLMKAEKQWHSMIPSNIVDNPNVQLIVFTLS